MNSWAAISWLVAPSAARRAICASWGVRSSRVSAVRLRACSPVASSSTRARSANASMPNSVNSAWARAELLARVEPTALPAQPFAVQEMATGELDPDAGPLEPLDRLAIEGLRRFPLGQQRPGAGLDPDRPVGSADPGCLRKPLEAVGRD